MAIGIRSVTTGTDNGSSATVSLTTSESPSATQVGDLVVVIHCNDYRDLTNMVAPTATGSPSMTLQGSADGGSLLSHIKVWTYVANTAGAQSISTTETGTHDGDKGLTAYVLSGADTTTPIDGSVVATTSPSTSVSTFVLTGVSPSGSDSLLFAHTRTSNGAGTSDITPPGSMTERYDVNNFTRFEGATEQLSASGATGTRTFTPASSVPYVAVMFAVKASGAAASIPYNPQRGIQGRDYGEAQWLQRDRRDANTVATAANPLPSPLDVAYGAGGPLWWQRGGAADAAPRTWMPQQRPGGDPSLLAPAAAAPPPAQQRTLQTRDSGEVQWLQRAYRDPSLLTAALLENELLGGAETITRVTVPATNAVRWWMPQQPARVAMTPGLLDTALLEPPLTTGDQRRRDHAALFTDRREFPQQRPYISDPSFYPTVAPTDPLTVAWGAGGTYWLLYNQPALIVDRRAVPQQRAYVSDPSLLTSALLEGPLLGGADSSRHAAWFTDRRGVRQQPARLTIPVVVVPADPLLLAGAGQWRRTAVAASHADRRRAGWQPPRWTVFTTSAAVCKVQRPFTGLVTYASGGTVSRPNTGTVEYCTCCT